MTICTDIMYLINLCCLHIPSTQFAITVGLKGLQNLVGHLPSWLSYTNSDKMDWLNEILNELWPFVDKGVCRLIKETVTPIINNQVRRCLKFKNVLVLYAGKHNNLIHQCSQQIRTYKVPIQQVIFKQVYC